MKAFLLLLFLSWLLNFFLPWWAALLPAFFIGAWLLESSFSAFMTGFLAVGFAWGLQALYIHIANEAILSTRIAEMMQVGSPYMVLLFTFLIGAVLGSLGVITGYYFKVIFRNNK
jgi:hypothetical protein